MAIDLKQVTELVKSERPNRQRLIREASEALALYYGGLDELKPLITMWSASEDPENYVTRVQITADNYRNFPKHIVAKYLEAIKRAGTIERKCDVPVVQDYLDERYQAWFWTEVAPYLLFLPEFWVQSANPEPMGDIQTKQDETDMQGSPYVVVHYPQFIRNFEVDRDGNLLWVTIERPVVQTMSSGATQSVLYVDYYDNAQFMTFVRKGGAKTFRKHTEPADHGFTRVPFLRFAHSENNALVGSPKIGHAKMADVTRGAKGLLHWVAMMIEAAHIHLRLILVGPKKMMDAIQEHGLGNSTFLPEDMNGLPVGSHPTRYLNKPKTEFDVLDRIVYERKTDEIYEAARLRDTTIKKAPESGFAKMLDMVPDLGVNAENRDYLKDCDERIVGLLCNGMQKPDAKVEVTYPDSFDIKTINEKTKEAGDATTAMRNGELPRSMTGDTLIAQGLYSDLLPNADDVTLTQIATELAEDALAMEAAEQAQTDQGTATYQPVPKSGEGEGL